MRCSIRYACLLGDIHSVPSIKDAQGNYFIDRNGRLFAPILDHLRCGHLDLPPGLTEAMLTRELDYYLIPHAKTKSEATTASVATDLYKRAMTVQRAMSKPMREQLWPWILAKLQHAADNGDLALRFSFSFYVGNTVGVSVADPSRSGGQTRSYSIQVPVQPTHSDVDDLARWIEETHGVRAISRGPREFEFSWSDPTVASRPSLS